MKTPSNKQIDKRKDYERTKGMLKEYGEDETDSKKHKIKKRKKCNNQK